MWGIPYFETNTTQNSNVNSTFEVATLSQLILSLANKALFFSRQLSVNCANTTLAR